MLGEEPGRDPPGLCWAPVRRDFLAGEYIGVTLLGHLLAMVVLFFGALQGITRAIMPGTRQVGRGIGRQAVRTILDRTFSTWISTYRTDLEADLHNVREPLHVLQSTFSPQDSSTKENILTN